MVIMPCHVTYLDGYPRSLPRVTIFTSIERELPVSTPYGFLLRLNHHAIMNGMQSLKLTTLWFNSWPFECNLGKYRAFPVKLAEPWNLPRDDSEMLDSQGTFQGHKSLVLMQHEEKWTVTLTENNLRAMFSR